MGVGPAILAGVGQGVNQGAQFGLLYRNAVKKMQQEEAWRKRYGDILEGRDLKTSSGGTYPRPGASAMAGQTPPAPMGAFPEPPPMAPPPQTAGVDPVAEANELSLAGVSSNAKGTSYVPEDELSMIHQGEAVIPAAQNPNNPLAGVDPPPPATMMAANTATPQAPEAPMPKGVDKKGLGGTQSMNPFPKPTPVETPDESAAYPEKRAAAATMGHNYQGGRLGARHAGQAYLKGSVKLPALHNALNELQQKQVEHLKTTGQDEAATQRDIHISRLQQEYDKVNSDVQEAAGFLITNGINPAALTPEHLSFMGIRTDPDFWEPVGTPPSQTEDARMLQTPPLARYRQDQPHTRVHR